MREPKLNVKSKRRRHAFRKRGKKLSSVRQKKRSAGTRRRKSAKLRTSCS